MPPYDDFQRYLAAKVAVDDRALNKDVWARLADGVRPLHARPLRVLEMGAGIGSMAQRLWRWRLHPHILYTGVDVSPQNIIHARQTLRAWARRQGASVLETQTGFVMHTPQRQMTLSLAAEDALTFVQRPEQQAAWDLLIAHAFLDLVDIATALPRLLATLEPGGFGYFTINFDGLTLFEPTPDETFEARLMTLYHRSMDARFIDGRPAGDSRTGRRLFAQLQKAGARVLAAGASDWVVIPREDGYPDDEAYFLHAIIHTVHRELAGHPELDRAQVDAWAQMRHAQIERGELLYIAHQLDYLVKREGSQQGKHLDDEGR